jgi:predicted homoserine dehydrogenase-like protein
MALLDLLHHRQVQNNPVGLALVGAGQMGHTMVSQLERMVGIRAIAVADLVRERAVTAYQTAGVPVADVIVTNDAQEANRALQDGMRIATDNGEMVTQLHGVEVVVDATGVPDAGARVALASILNQKHIVMLTVETDVTVGYLLRRLADAAGVVYTVSAGDEPGAVKELYDFATTMGFRVVAAGKGKNNPLNQSATPDDLAAEASAKHMNTHMLTAFVDGTKTMVEMTALANATGLVPEVRGMHGPTCTVEELSQVFALKSQGGILEREGVVDYALGSVAPGVFVVVTTDQEPVIEDLQYLKVGPGPNWVFYRPYHLANLETPLSAAQAVLLGETTIATLQPPVAETITVAKKDLRSGERLDGIGGYTVRGSVEVTSITQAENLLPLGLAKNARLKSDVAEGSAITYDQVVLDYSSTIVHLRALQDWLV